MSDYSPKHWDEASSGRSVSLEIPLHDFDIGPSQTSTSVSDSRSTEKLSLQHESNRQMFRHLSWSARSPPPSTGSRSSIAEPSPKNKVASDEEIMNAARQELSADIDALMKEVEAEEDAAKAEPKGAFYDFDPQTETNERFGGIPTATNGHRLPPIAARASEEVEVHISGRLWQNDRLAKELGQLAKSGQLREAELGLMRAERSILLRDYDRKAKELSDVKLLIDNVDWKLRYRTDEDRQSREQELTTIQAAKRKLQQTSDWLDKEEQKRMRSR
ncbi:MAG: hypothetical protein Q9223_006103 [Gallowayella weberi]